MFFYNFDTICNKDLEFSGLTVDISKNCFSIRPNYSIFRAAVPTSVMPTSWLTAWLQLIIFKVWWYTLVEQHVLYHLSNCNGSFHYHLPGKYNLVDNNHYHMYQKNDGDCILLLHQSSGAWKIFPCAPFLSQVTFLTIRSIHLKCSVKYLHPFSIFSGIPSEWFFFLLARKLYQNQEDHRLNSTWIKSSHVHLF